MSNLKSNANGTITISVDGIDTFFNATEDYVYTEDGKIILKHGAIMSMANALGISVTAPKILSSFNQSNYVVQREAVKDSKSEIGIGESIPFNLDTDIAKKYPFITADTRAYDRAVLALLGLSGKVYSDFEITIKNNNNSAPAQTKPEPSAKSTAQAEKTVSASHLNSDALEEKSENVAPPQQNEQPEPSQAITPSQKESTPAVTQNSDTLPAWWNEPDTYGAELNPDVFIVNKGPHKDENITVNRLLETEKSSVEWFANKALSKVEEFNKMIISCRRALKAAAQQ